MGTYETAVVEVGIVEGTLGYIAAAIVDVDQFGGLEGRILEAATRERRIHDIAAREITIRERREIKETHTEKATREQAEGKGRSSKGTAVEAFCGEIRTVEKKPRGVNVLDDAFTGDQSHDPVRFDSRIAAMQGACFGACKDG